MHKSTFLKKSAVFLVLGLTATSVWSFGGGGGRPSRCVEPEFKNMKPVKIIAPGGEFSFTASTNTDPKSIKVIIKNQEIDLNVRDHYGFQVRGNMPAEVMDGYALIKISAYSKQPASCLGEDSWLVKIEP